jgi:hypothetical protein
MTVLPPKLDPPARPRALPPARPRPTSRPASRRRLSVDAATVAWPIALALLLTALALWRTSGDEHPSRGAAVAAPVLAGRTFGDLRLDVPRTWTTLERTEDRITWGTSERTHTVTLAGTEAASAPLLAVVREVVRQSVDALPGTRVIDGPTLATAAEPMPRGDSAVVVQFEVDEGSRRLRIIQAWRRDARAGRDLVATWTSGDGTWPVDPRVAVPSSTGH